MRKTTYVLVLLATLLGVKASLALEVGSYAVVDANKLNVRAGPGGSHTVIARMPKGMGLKVLSRSGDWVKIQTSTRSKETGWEWMIYEGWVSTKFVRSPSALEAHEAKEDSGDWLLYWENLSETYSTPIGNLVLRRKARKEEIFVGEKSYDVDDFLVSIVHKTNHWFLIQRLSGGTACPAMFQWVNADGPELVLSEVFGACLDGFEIEEREGSVRVVVMAGAASVGQVAFDYDGNEVVESSLGLRDNIVENVFDPLSWEGKHPYDYLSAAGNEGMLIDLIGWSNLERARWGANGAGNRMKKVDDWIVGRACQRAMCYRNKTAVAISIRTGKPVIAVKEEGENWEIFGSVQGQLPVGLRQAMYD